MEIAMSSDCCGACLTRGRRLGPLGAERAARVLRAAEHRADTAAVAMLSICWECRALVEKSITFCERVRRAQNLLLEENLIALTDNENNEESMSNLCRTTKIGYDLVLQHADVKYESIENTVSPVKAAELYVCTLGSQETERKHEIDPTWELSMSPIDFPDVPTDEELNQTTLADVKNDSVDPSPDDIKQKLEDGLCIVMRDLTKRSTIYGRTKITYEEPPNVTIKRIRGGKPENCKFINDSKKSSKRIPKNLANSLTESGVTVKMEDSEDRPQRESRIRTVLMTEDEMRESRDVERKSEAYGKSLFKCDTCIVGFMNQAFLDQHNESKHNPELEHACSICEVRFPHADSIKWHRRTHYQLFVCRCGYSHRLQAHINSHYAREHEPHRLFTCTECHLVFPKQRQLSYHKEKEHSALKACPHCDKTFTSRASYSRHLEMHTGGAYYTCAVCSKRVRGKELLRAHMRTHAPTADADEAFCAECNLQFKNKYLYRAHLRYSLKHVSRDDLKHLCDQCDKRFASPGALRKHHDLVHLRKELYKCETCNKNYSSRQALTQHRLKIHEGVRPEKNKFCELCGKAFSSMTVLATHKRIHTGERPLKCDTCEATFRQSGALYKHCDLVHGKRQRADSTPTL